MGGPTTEFLALGLLDDQMELGFPDEVGPRDLHMADYGAGSLKQGRSPPKPSTPIAGGSTSSSAIFVSPVGVSKYVSPSLHNLVGVPGARVSMLMENLGLSLLLRSPRSLLPLPR